MNVYEIDDFDQILEEAEDQAKTEWEIKFVSDIRDKLDEYGEETLISERQLEVLTRIAKW